MMGSGLRRGGLTGRIDAVGDRDEPQAPTFRLLRGYALHRSYPITSKPLPARAMLLKAIHPMDSMTYEPADIELYVI